MHRGLASLNRSSGFSGSVVALEPTEIQPVVERAPLATSIRAVPIPEPAPLLATVLGRLTVLQPKSAELKERLAKVVGQLSPLLNEADALETACVEEWRSDLEAQWQAVRVSGRKQQAECVRLDAEARQAELTLQNVAGRQESALGELRELKAVEERGQAVPRWATDKELEEWEQKVNKAKGRVNEANADAVEALQARNLVAESAEKARAELARLGTEEIRLRNTLTGQPFIDSEFGLSSTPSFIRA